MQKLKKAQDDLAAQLATAQAKIEDLETRAAHQPSPARDAQEQEAAREGRIGNLGWDSPADVLKERAVEALQTAGIPPTSSIAPVTWFLLPEDWAQVACVSWQQYESASETLMVMGAMADEQANVDSVGAAWSYASADNSG